MSKRKQGSVDQPAAVAGQRAYFLNWHVYALRFVSMGERRLGSLWVRWWVL